MLPPDLPHTFPNSIVPVPTAIPAFVGYTPAASYQGKSCLNRPIKIESWSDFMAFFGRTDETSGNLLPESDQYRPLYSLVKATAPTAADLVLGSQGYNLQPHPGTIYHLYHCLQLFYANGGGSCYIVSVGTYPANPLPVGDGSSAQPVVNRSIDLDALQQGLQLVAGEADPTMIVVPDAVLLAEPSHQALNQAILAQCGQLESRVGLLDLWDGDNPDPNARDRIVANFRSGVGSRDLSYGVAYFPFLKTSVVTDAAIDYRNIGVRPLIALLTELGDTAAVTLLQQAPTAHPPGSMEPSQLESALLGTSPFYAAIHDALLAKANILPPSAALAGIYTYVDNAQGVWTAPANIAVNATTDTTQQLSDADQATLNLDPVTGKSINAIRLFPGQGVTVWGARTLDGNSDDWRYIQVRRMLIYVEQSLKLALGGYVFEPNDANTWALVSSMVNNFLTSLWSQGALVGATPADAFSVAVGLGTTMTADDILNGIMRISVKVAVTHPAEFIVIDIAQQMQTS